MSTMKVDENSVIRQCEIILKETLNRLDNDDKWLHNNGYHKYADAVCNLRCRIEKSLGEMVDELTEG